MVARKVDGITLEPLTRLAWIELTDAAYRTGAHGNLWNSVVVAPGAAETPEGVRLSELQAVQFDGISEYGATIGRFTARRHYGANAVVLEPAFPSAMMMGDEARAECLRAEQVIALGENAPVWPSDGVAYATAWLANPGELTAEGQAILDQRAADEAARQEQIAENTRVREAAEAARAADLQRQAEVAARSRDLFASHRRAAPPPSDLVTLAKDADAPLPWRMNHKGDVIAADGSPVISGGASDRGEARMRLMVLALNAAGGIETPNDDPDPNPKLDRDGFVAAMQADLTKRGEPGDAGAILESFLTDGGVAYGDDGWAWTPDGAQHLVAEHLAARDDDGDETEADA